MNRCLVVMLILVVTFPLSARRRQTIVGVADLCENERTSAGLSYILALEQAGYIPVVLPRSLSEQSVKQVFRHLDALLLMGGEDVEPWRYGAQPSPRLGGTNAQRDSLEYVLLSEASRRRIPIMGVCRGIQMINVFFGGTLYQDLPSEYPVQEIHHAQGAAEAHRIDILPGSLLHDALSADTIWVNSTHHQAVRDLAPGFTVTAKAQDGVVEAIENPRLRVAAVQFHPEALIRNGKTQFLGIFRRFLSGK